MNVSELTGAELDAAVAKAEGLTIDGVRGGEVIVGVTPNREVYAPSKLWRQGGPIIEREHINLSISDGGEWWAERRLLADGTQGFQTSYSKAVSARGPTPPHRRHARLCRQQDAYLGQAAIRASRFACSHAAVLIQPTDHSTS